MYGLCMRVRFHTSPPFRLVEVIRHQSEWVRNWRKEMGDGRKNAERNVNQFYIWAPNISLYSMSQSQRAWSWQTDGGRSWVIDDVKLSICNPSGGEAMGRALSGQPVCCFKKKTAHLPQCDVFLMVALLSCAGRVWVSLPLCVCLFWESLHTFYLHTYACSLPLSLFVFVLPVD